MKFMINNEETALGLVLGRVITPTTKNSEAKGVTGLLYIEFIIRKCRMRSHNLWLSQTVVESIFRLMLWCYFGVYQINTNDNVFLARLLTVLFRVTQASHAISSSCRGPSKLHQSDCAT